MDDETQRVVYCGNLDPQVTEELLTELFVQGAPIECVTIPKERSTGRKRNFAFVMLNHVSSMEYVCQLFNGLRLFGRPIDVKPRLGSNRGTGTALLGNPSTPNRLPHATALFESPQSDPEDVNRASRKRRVDDIQHAHFMTSKQFRNDQQHLTYSPHTGLIATDPGLNQAMNMISSTPLVGIPAPTNASSGLVNPPFVERTFSGGGSNSGHHRHSSRQHYNRSDHSRRHYSRR